MVANGQRSARIATFLLGASAATVLAFLIYATRRYQPGMSWPQLVTVYILPTVGLMGLAAALRAPVAVRVNVLLVLLSVGITVYAVEIALLLRPYPGPSPHASTDPAQDSRTMLEVVRDLRAEGERAYPEPGAWRLRDLSFRIGGQEAMALQPIMAHSLVVYCNETGEWVTYRSDEHGFRNPPGSWSHPPIDVLLIGDSFVHGQCVGDGETLAANIRHHWPETLSLGVRGAGPLHELAMLREFGPLLQPRVTVWFYYEGNDLADLEDEGKSPLLSGYLASGHRQQIAERQRLFDRALRSRLDALVAESTLREREGRGNIAPPNRIVSVKAVVKLTSLRAALGFAVHFPREDPLGMLPRVLGEAQRTVGEWGGELVLVYLPMYGRYVPLGAEAVTGRTELLEAASRMNLALVDVHEHFRRTYGDPRQLWVNSAAHLTAGGYGAVADAVTEAIGALPSLYRQEQQPRPR